MEKEKKYLAVLDDTNKVLNITLFSKINNDIYSDGPNSTIKEPFHCVMLCNCSYSLAENEAIIGWYLNEDIKKFVPPQPDPTYIFNEEECRWKPNENLLYKPFNDEFLYRPGPQGLGWIKKL